MKSTSKMLRCPEAENRTKRTYLPPTLTVYGKVSKLTRSGSSGVVEGPSNSRNKRP